MDSNEAGLSPRDTRFLVAGLLAAVCIAIYGQVLWFTFINYDDNLYVYENQFVLSGLTGASLKWAFTTFHSANWHPVTWLSHMLDASLFGTSAGGYHFVNVIFHAANSVLAFAVFNRLTGDVWKSAVVAFLFAVHPAHVESVAWVSERKDVLSTFFWLLTMWFYGGHAAEQRTRSGLSAMTSSAMLLTVGAFVVGLMSKPMLVTLPFVLLLLDYWPLARLKTAKDLQPLVLEKLPLFLLSAASAYITIRAQSFGGAVQSLQVIPVDARILNAIVSYAKYLGMLVYPVDLGVGYSYVFPLPMWQVIASTVILLAITALCIWQRRERKYLLVGWLWFLGTMVPVIGLIQVGSQSMADRYTYVPYFGLFVMVVWGGAELFENFELNRASTAVVVAIPLIALSVLAFNQTSKWRNSETLYKHSLDTGHGSFAIMLNYCNALMTEDRLAEAEIQCRNSVTADPGYAFGHISLGVVQARTGRFDEAIRSFRRAIEIRPEDPMGYANLAGALTFAGQIDASKDTLDRAAELYRQSGGIPPTVPTMYSNLAGNFAQQQRYDKAAESLRRVLELAPQRTDARANYALALYFLGRTTEARTEIDQAIRQSPNQPESYNILGMILMKQGDREGAVVQFQKALQLKPDFKDAKDNLDRANTER